MKSGELQIHKEHCVICGGKVPENRYITCSHLCAVEQNRRMNKKENRKIVKAGRRGRMDTFHLNAF